MPRRQPWLTRSQREAQKEAIAEAGGVSAWIRRGSDRRAITDEERARHAAANAVADEFCFPRPYPDLDDYPHADP